MGFAELLKRRGSSKGFFSRGSIGDGTLIIPSNYRPPGEIAMHGGTTAPDGWLKCDGSAVSRGSYADLFGAIGTAYGAGNGFTTFNLPDFSDRFPVGMSPGASGGASSHDHGAATGTAGSHQHASAGDHAHASAGAHDHGAATGTAGSHQHAADGGHTHGSPLTSGPSNSISVGLVGLLTTAAGPAHTHSVVIPTSGSHQHDATGNHSHVVASGGTHSHASAGSHQHDEIGDHSHVVASDGDHSHASAGSHQHDETGDHSHVVASNDHLPPFTGALFIIKT